MGAREDLLAVATSLAGRASSAALSGQPITYESIRVATLAEGAKAALEAAALVDAEPAPIISAAERLHANLKLLGADAGIEVAAQFGAAEAIDAVTELVGDFSGIARRNAGLEAAYERLHELCKRLSVDFGAAETETASRIAARINAAMQDAEQSLGATRGEG